MFAHCKVIRSFYLSIVIPCYFVLKQIVRPFFLMPNSKYVHLVEIPAINTNVKANQSVQTKSLFLRAEHVLTKHRPVLKHAIGKVLLNTQLTSSIVKLVKVYVYIWETTFYILKVLISTKVQLFSTSSCNSKTNF